MSWSPRSDCTTVPMVNAFERFWKLGRAIANGMESVAITTRGEIR